MTTSDLQIHASAALLETVGARDDSELRLLLVAKLFELGKISIGRGAELCGLPVATFIQKMGALGIPVINYSLEELRAELNDV